MYLIKNDRFIFIKEIGIFDFLKQFVKAKDQYLIMCKNFYYIEFK